MAFLKTVPACVRSASLAFLLAAAAGCGSQQLRLTAPDSRAGTRYTCTTLSGCYPASLAPADQGPAADDAIQLSLPEDCHGRVSEIVVREAGSSSPEIDVTCALAQPTATHIEDSAPTASAE